MLDAYQYVQNNGLPSRWVGQLHAEANDWLQGQAARLAVESPDTFAQKIKRAAMRDAIAAYQGGMCLTPAVAAILRMRLPPVLAPLARVPLPGVAAASPLVLAPVLFALVGHSQPADVDAVGSADPILDEWDQRTLRSLMALAPYGLLGLPQMWAEHCVKQQKVRGEHHRAAAMLALGWTVLLEPARLLFQALYIGLSVALGLPAAAVGAVAGAAVALGQSRGRGSTQLAAA